ELDSGSGGGFSYDAAAISRMAAETKAGADSLDATNDRISLAGGNSSPARSTAGGAASSFSEAASAGSSFAGTSGASTGTEAPQDSPKAAGGSAPLPVVEVLANGQANGHKNGATNGADKAIQMYLGHACIDVFLI